MIAQAWYIILCRKLACFSTLLLPRNGLNDKGINALLLLHGYQCSIGGFLLKMHIIKKNKFSHRWEQIHSEELLLLHLQPHESIIVLSATHHPHRQNPPLTSRGRNHSPKALRVHPLHHQTASIELQSVWRLSLHLGSEELSHR